ncbi:uncharacterized protein DEA37_0004443, partial [Paragonimus westermani]
TIRRTPLDLNTLFDLEVVKYIKRGPIKSDVLTTVLDCLNLKSTTMSAFLGSWKLKSSDNFDAVLQKLGVNVVKRKLITSTKPEVTFTMEGDKMTMKTCSALKTTTITFEFGKEFDEHTADDRDVKSTVTKESENKLVHVQKHPDSVTTTVREVSGDTMTATVTVGDVKAVNTYQKE